MLDSGSMACTLSEGVELEMLSKKLITEPIPFNQDVVLVGCGGSLSKPKCMYEVEMKLYGESCIVPVLVVPGQRDDLIVGTNVIRFIMHQLKVTSDYWNLVSSGNLLPECEPLLDLLQTHPGGEVMNSQIRLGLLNSSSQSLCWRGKNTWSGVNYLKMLLCHLAAQYSLSPPQVSRYHVTLWSVASLRHCGVIDGSQ